MLLAHILQTGAGAERAGTALPILTPCSWRWISSKVKVRGKKVSGLHACGTSGANKSFL